MNPNMFVVALKNGDSNIDVGEYTVDLKNYGVVLCTLEELRKYYLEYGDDFETRRPEINNEYIKCIKRINAGQIIISGQFDYDSDDPIEYFLYKFGIPRNNKHIEIISIN